ncbi:MAG: hypothetical protein L3J43_04590 [Sulfurovum sp.]|nr:hypothetical protein [Sulfurovum sp.]
MKLLMMVMMLLSTIWAEEIRSKMIIGAYTESEEAAKSLYELEKSFKENEKIKVLKDTYDLALEMELLDKYILVVVTGIKGYSVANKLQYLLKEKFKNSFIVNYNKTIEISGTKEHLNTSSTHRGQKEINYLDGKRKTLFSTVNIEWIALILLALIGFILSYRSARQFVKIRALQKEIAKYHIILEDEVDNLGVKHG